MSAYCEKNKRERIQDDSDNYECKRLSMNEDKEITFWNYRWLINFTLIYKVKEYSEIFAFWIYNDIQEEFIKRLINCEVYGNNYMIFIVEILKNLKFKKEGWLYLKDLREKTKVVINRDTDNFYYQIILNIVNGPDKIIDQILNNPAYCMMPIEYNRFDLEHLERQRTPNASTYYRSEFYVLEIND